MMSFPPTYLIFYCIPRGSFALPPVNVLSTLGGDKKIEDFTNEIPRPTIPPTLQGAVVALNFSQLKHTPVVSP